jgi:hypothetical protein
MSEQERKEKQILYDYDHAKAQIQLLLKGDVDYVEAGDCRIPGAPSSLRALSTGDSALPIGLYGAGQVPSSQTIERVTENTAIERLKARRAQMESALGLCSRIFTVKLRKAWSEAE